MATATLEPETFADLLESLGDVPLERIIIKPPLGAATEADVLAYLCARRKRICELIDGVLVEKAMGLLEAMLAGAILDYLREIVLSKDLGIVVGADGMIRLWEGRVRIPDVAFISWERLPGKRVPTEPIPSVAPDLCVEVLSTTNTAQELQRKREDYFSAGVSQVWEIDPRQRTCAVYTSVAESTLLNESAVLEGNDLLPGFKLPLAKLIAEMDRHG